MPRRRSWGAGEVYEEQSGKWAVRWREGRRRLYRGGLGSKAFADRVLATIRGNLAARRAGLPPDPNTTPPLGELADDFLERRKASHRAAAEDEGRWKNHMAPFFSHLHPGEIDVARIRAFVEVKRRELNPATVRICVSLLSSLYVDLQERHLAQVNPCRGLPRSLMRLMRSTHDPRTVPFIERLEDVRRIHLALPAPLHVAYAIGALAGLRTGEVFALRWPHVDLGTRRIHVRESVKGPLKDKDSRVVPILDALQPILAAWQLETGGKGLVIPPLRSDGEKIDKHTPGKYLRPVLKELGWKAVAEYRDAWYAATRHTFASQWVMAGASIEKLKEILGHYSVAVTERYAHLKPELFTAEDLGTLSLDFAPVLTAPIARVPSGTIRSASRTGELLHPLVRDAEQLRDVSDRQAEPLPKLPHGRGSALLGFGLDGVELRTRRRGARDHLARVAGESHIVHERGRFRRRVANRKGQRFAYPATGVCDRAPVAVHAGDALNLGDPPAGLVALVGDSVLGHDSFSFSP